MRKFGIALAALLATSAACPETDHDEPLEVRKPVEPSPTAPAAPTADDHEFANVRTSYENAIRERLNKIDAEIASLATSTDKQMQESAAKLRSQRDALVTRFDTIEYQAKSGWDEFQADVNHEVEQLEDAVEAVIQ